MSNNTHPSTAAPAGTCRTRQGGRIDRSQTVQFHFNGETLTGYAGGLPRKQALLELEGAIATLA